MEEIKKVQSMLDAFIKSTTLTDKQKESMQLIVEELNSSNAKADEINKSRIEFETKFNNKSIAYDELQKNYISAIKGANFEPQQSGNGNEKIRSLDDIIRDVRKEK